MGNMSNASIMIADIDEAKATMQRMTGTVTECTETIRDFIRKSSELQGYLGASLDNAIPVIQGLGKEVDQIDETMKDVTARFQAMIADVEAVQGVQVSL